MREIKIDKDKLTDLLREYFGVTDNKKNYYYELQRTKSALYNTVTIDDFQEFNDNTIEEIVDYIFEREALNARK